MKTKGEVLAEIAALLGRRADDGDSFVTARPIPPRPRPSLQATPERRDP